MPPTVVFSLTPYLPAGSRGDVVITSRNPQCHNHHTVGLVSLNAPTSAEELFTKADTNDNINLGRGGSVWREIVVSTRRRWKSRNRNN
jgi:hypothetical protein